MHLWRRKTDGRSESGIKQASSDDIVYPLHMLDQAQTLRPIIVAWTLRFDAVLDTQLLTSSLAHLLTVGDWRKLGGRLKQDGSLEIHSPTSFSSERPAFTFSHVSFDQSISDHELGRLLPKTTDGPSIQGGPAEFRLFAAHDSAPSTLNDFLKGDLPVLSLHITSFTDATLLALSWPHVLMDVIGQQALVHNWSLVLADRIAEVSPLLGAHEDAILLAAAAEPIERRESYQMQTKALSGLGKLSFGVRMGWDMLWESCETRSIFLRRTTIAKLREQAFKDVANKAVNGEAPFLSDGDILTGWMAHIISSSLPSPRPLTVLHAMNARFRVTALQQKPGVFVQNMAVPSFTLLSSQEAAGSTGKIAFENRRQLTRQATEGQIVAFIRGLMSQPPASQDPANTLVGEVNALLMPFTDWCKADFFNTIDFWPAVIKSGNVGKQDVSAAGKVVYYHASAMRPNPFMRNVVVIYGKTRDGGYWLNGTFTATTWAKVESAMSEI